MTIATNAPDDSGFSLVSIPATAGTPEAVIRFLVGQMVTAGHLSDDDTEAVVGQVLRRELLGTTGIGKGIALPHASCEAVRHIAAVVGRVTGPLAWPTLDSGNSLGGRRPAPAPVEHRVTRDSPHLARKSPRAGKHAVSSASPEV